MKQPRTTGILGWVLFLVLAVTACPQAARAQGPNRAGLVVQLRDGTQITRCIEFTEPQISGYDLLLRSGLDLEISTGEGMGAFVCGIAGEGCPVHDCMCDYPPNYWSYWHLEDGAWVYAQMGIGGRMVGPGDVEGWTWGVGSAPAVLVLDQICAPAATDTPTPTPTWTQIPSTPEGPSPTPPPTDTPPPSPTWVPTPTPVPPTPPPAPTSSPLPTVPPTVTVAPTDAVSLTSPPSAAAAAPTAVTVHTPIPAADSAAGAPPPPPTTAAADPPTALPGPAPETAEPTLTVADLASPTAVEAPPSPDPTITATSLPTATTTPTALAVAALAPGPEQDEPVSESQAHTGDPGGANLLTWLSVGAGLAYLSFAGFVILLGALFLVARFRQR